MRQHVSQFGVGINNEAASINAALDEIAEKLTRIKGRFGPRAIAAY
ncbi:hypothetical protein [Pseudomonas fluorescens]|nr:hypothetical protein [Pseudomonas fluorescens]